VVKAYAELQCSVPGVNRQHARQLAAGATRTRKR
jgi:hypothetical protein